MNLLSANNLRWIDFEIRLRAADELARFVDDAVVFGRDKEPRLTSFLASVMRLDTSALIIGETSMGTGINFEF
jgi:hypothetical protein